MNITQEKPRPTLKGLPGLFAALADHIATLEYQQAALQKAVADEKPFRHADVASFCTGSDINHLDHLLDVFITWTKDNPPPPMIGWSVRRQCAITPESKPEEFEWAFLKLQSAAWEWKPFGHFVPREGLVHTATYNRMVQRALDAERIINDRMSRHQLFLAGRIGVSQLYPIYRDFETSCQLLTEVWFTLLNPSREQETAWLREPITKEDLRILAEFIAAQQQRWLSLTAKMSNLYRRFSSDELAE